VAFKVADIVEYSMVTKFLFMTVQIEYWWKTIALTLIHP